MVICILILALRMQCFKFLGELLFNLNPDIHLSTCIFIEAFELKFQLKYDVHCVVLGEQVKVLNTWLRPQLLKLRLLLLH